MLLGGGGYTIRNVARCWTYETSVALDQVRIGFLNWGELYFFIGKNFISSLARIVFPH